MGHIYLYTGTGGGKTTNALGLVMRSVGHNHKAVVIQFMKWWKNTGEYKIQKRLAPYYEIYQFGREGWHGLKNLGEEDRKLAKKGLEFAKKIVKEKNPHLLVLDEVNLAVHCKLLSVEEILKLLDMVSEKTNVVLTGRYAPERLIDLADFVNEIKDIKHPEKIPSTKGIQY
jgi:cob(I)alamin adenosyltransferase